MSTETHMAALAKVYKALLASQLGATAKDKFDCWIQKGELHSAFEQRGRDMVVGRLFYEAVFDFEALPEARLNPALLMAVTNCWLADHDEARDYYKLGAPRLEVDAYQADDRTPLSDLLITIPFVQPITMVPDDAGLIVLGEQRWSLGEAPVWIAEALSVATPAGEVASTEHIAPADPQEGAS